MVRRDAMSEIIIVLFSEIDERLVKAMSRALEQTFSADVLIRRQAKPLDSAYVPSRNQYSSPRLLARLRRIKKDPGDKVLGITEVDLYSPGYDFVFGEAETASGVATLSLYRLQPSRSHEELLKRRAIKEAVHEIGHLYGLGHCESPGCVMRVCTSVAHVDRKHGSFCNVCRAGLDE